MATQALLDRIVELYAAAGARFSPFQQANLVDKPDDYLQCLIAQLEEAQREGKPFALKQEGAP